MSAKIVAALFLLSLAVPSRALAPASGHIDSVDATLDRMPGPSFIQPNLQLSLSVRLRNLGAASLPVKLDRVYTSYDPAKQGTQLKDLSVTDRKICGTDSCAQFTLPAGTDLGNFSVVAQGLSPDGHGRRLYVTLVLQVGSEVVELRGSCDLTTAD